MSAAPIQTTLTLPAIGTAPPNWPALDSFGITTDWLNHTVSPNRRMAIILAHPDDETFSCGASIACAVDAGVEVHYICATRGECGEGDPQLLATEPVANVRTAELRCAAGSLGLHAIHYLNYRDSGMAGSPNSQHKAALSLAPAAELSAKVVTLLRAIRPEVVITHGSYGGYGHPDHIQVHRAVVDAWDAVGIDGAVGAYPSLELPSWQPSRLYAITFDPRPLKLFTTLLRLAGRNPARFGDNGDVNLLEAARQATPVTCRPNLTDWAAMKERAALCHRTQLGPYRLLLRLPRPIRAGFIASEGYTRLIPPVTPGEPVERDFFPERSL